jgi:hypothetical protein
VRQEAALFVEGDVTDKDQRDPTNAGVVHHSVLTGSEQCTGSIAGDLSSVPNRASEGGRESLGKAARTGASVPSFNMNRTDSSSREFTSISTYDHMANRDLEMCLCTLSNPFSNCVTSGVSPAGRPSRRLTGQRKLPLGHGRALYTISRSTATALLDSYTDCVLSLEKACMSCRIRTSIQLTRGCETIV